VLDKGAFQHPSRHKSGWEGCARLFLCFSRYARASETASNILLQYSSRHLALRLCSVNLLNSGKRSRAMNLAVSFLVPQPSPNSVLRTVLSSYTGINLSRKTPMVVAMICLSRGKVRVFAGEVFFSVCSMKNSARN